MKYFWFILMLGFIFCKKEVGKPVKADFVKVNITWDNKGLSPTMKLYEPPAQRPFELWQTGNAKTLSEMPISTEIEGAVLYLKPNSKKLFVLVMRNDSAEPVYFFAAPHQVSPAEYSLGFKFKCLCINHAFQIPPGEYWYRVVELRMGENFVGDSIDIKHALVGITKDRMTEFENMKSGSHEETH
jgi:hypothetical protein